MVILVLRTDKPESEIGLYNDKNQLVHEIWQAHRQLAETLHSKIATMLQNQSKAWNHIEGVVIYHGPGSFTGLRIGLSVANALANSFHIPIVGLTGDDWVTNGIQQILDGQGKTIALLDYGAPVHITAPKK